jgi:hypothetical protein
MVKIFSCIALRYATRLAFGREEGIFSLLTHDFPLQRALRALGHAGLSCSRAYGASAS